MAFFKKLGLGFAALVFVVAVAPSLVSAQAANPCPWNFSNSPGLCGTGSLQVYVQVTQPTQGTPYNPSNFTVQVQGVNPSPASFQGSLNGTLVSLGAGAYTVSIPSNSYNFQPSYSQGCTGTIYGGQNALCVITLTSNAGYYPYVIPYQGPYISPQLTCTPSYQSAAIGQTVSFAAQGGAGAVYTWSTPAQYFGSNTGPTFTTTFNQSGTQVVTVSNGNQTATCTVNVAAAAGPVIYPSAPVAPTPAVTSTYYPAPTLPNTGFAPTNGFAFALAAVLLIAAGFAVSPYVRKTVITIVR